VTVAPRHASSAAGLYVAFVATLLVAASLGFLLFRPATRSESVIRASNDGPHDNVLLLDEPVPQR
jgi:hypothetical protein